ncbi:fimbrial protein [Parabacteroides sp. AM08-6]|uniref:fimbrial protein n=1 Tax=Parabacteroides sp. AM08-6 TaxID=2292053 RepID=UPI000EFDBFB2|nr:fimbrial protein [Parabacteroides sp. AM08-6]RHJ86441.1 hypothetical protein DW103_01815 [Parabacteroides sp. AM08-6]
MKLRNLFLASLAICTMASCSKDEDGPSIPQEVDAYLSIAAVPGDLVAKASEKGEEELGETKEQVVNTLTAFVFKAGETDAPITDESLQTFVISKTVAIGTSEVGDSKDAIVGKVGDERTITAIKGIHVKVAAPEGATTTSKTQFKVVLVANCKDLSATSVKDLKTKLTPDILSFGGVGTSYLPMSSEPLTINSLTPYTTEKHIQNWFNGDSQTPVTIENGTDNTGATTVGTAATLIRAISRVQIESLNTNFQGQYKGATFTVDAIYLVNVRATETIMRQENADAIYYRGGLQDYTVLDKLIDENSVSKTEPCSLWKKYTENNILSSSPNATFNTFKSYINVNSPNGLTGSQTRLIIAGDLKLQNGTAMGRKYFHIPLKDVGDAGNVVNNKIYKITATITGEGNPEPDQILDNACINFTITVANWQVVDQTEEDIN